MSLELVKSNEQRLPVVAIDGPAGAGKSTAARLLASQLGFTLVDTGAIYRCVAMHAIENGMSLDDEANLVDLCKKLKFQFGTLEKSSKNESEGLHIPKLHVYCNGVDVTDMIRSPELGLAASNVSKLPGVRAALIDIQRTFGKSGGIVMEGRDIGTVIFPNAELKFFLTASLESRALRRQEELKLVGIDKPLERILAETKARDDQDQNRKVSPLKQAPDALLIDSTQTSLEDVVAQMSRIVREYLKSC